eukprot:TRINITY_DN10735_c0_g1_i1.p1 TRINITY_DN10735_c0_g1~~TRINITY_DN10735_c0_g1_i1.p1  ORF type:complete len:113 (+),score=27.22 TRINITY_DN10735_c0_g1_i1:49-339(+)
MEVQRTSVDGQFGYTVSYVPIGSTDHQSFYPFSGVNEELKAFVHDIVHAASEDKSEPDPRSSLIEGLRDVAVIEAMLLSSTKQGCPVPVNNFRLKQ